ARPLGTPRAFVGHGNPQQSWLTTMSGVANHVRSGQPRPEGTTMSGGGTNHVRKGQPCAEGGQTTSGEVNHVRSGRPPRSVHQGLSAVDRRDAGSTSQCVAVS